jgi:hypothetical protein
MGEMRNVYTIVVAKWEGRILLKWISMDVDVFLPNFPSSFNYGNRFQQSFLKPRLICMAESTDIEEGL